jgi:hypothetical protein
VVVKCYATTNGLRRDFRNYNQKNLEILKRDQLSASKQQEVKFQITNPKRIKRSIPLAITKLKNLFTKTLMSFKFKEDKTLKRE